MTVDVLQVADAGEGHLLFHVVSEPLAAYSVFESRGNVGTEENAPVDHGLQGETGAEGERLTPVAAYIAHTGLVFELYEVVGHVGIFGLESCSACWEIPVVFAVVVHSGAIAVVMLVLEVDIEHVLCL